MRSLQNLKQGVLWLALALVMLMPALLAFSGLMGKSWFLSICTQIAIGLLIFASYQVLSLYAGLLSFGHALYVGIGAYAAAALLGYFGNSPWLVLALPLISGFISALLALLPSLCTLRSTGSSFAMISFGLCELMHQAAQSLPSIFGGEAGMSVNRGTFFGAALPLYVLVAVYAFAVFFLLFVFCQSKYGLQLEASRERASRLVFLGYSLARIRLMALLVSALVAGIAGALGLLYFEFVSASVFSAERSMSYVLYSYLAVVLFALLGFGAKSKTLFFAAIVSALLMVLSQSWLSLLTNYWGVWTGFAFVLLVWWHSKNSSSTGEPHHA